MTFIYSVLQISSCSKVGLNLKLVSSLPHKLIIMSMLKSQVLMESSHEIKSLVDHPRRESTTIYIYRNFFHNQIINPC